MTNDQQQLLRYHPNELDGVKVQDQGVLGVEWVGGESEAVRLEGAKGPLKFNFVSARFPTFCCPSRLSNAALQVLAKAYEKARQHQSFCEI